MLVCRTAKRHSLLLTLFYLKDYCFALAFLEICINTINEVEVCTVGLQISPLFKHFCSKLKCGVVFYFLLWHYSNLVSCEQRQSASTAIRRLSCGSQESP